MLEQVNVNAKQYNLTGCAVMTDTSLNVIVVEGGAKGLKKYKRLMLHRIKWSDDEDEMDSDDEDAKPPNKCVLVWEVCWPAYPICSDRLCRTRSL